MNRCVAGFIRIFAHRAAPSGAGSPQPPRAAGRSSRIRSKGPSAGCELRHFHMDLSPYPRKGERSDERNRSGGDSLLTGSAPQGEESRRQLRAQKSAGWRATSLQAGTKARHCPHACSGRSTMHVPVFRRFPKSDLKGCARIVRQEKYFSTRQRTALRFPMHL